jgi:hypothetical protein
MVTEPIGTKAGVGGGYMLPLMEETANDVILPFNASMPLVEIALVDKELIAALVMLPLIVLKLKVPIVSAVNVPLLTKIDDTAAALIMAVLRKSALKVSAVIRPVLRKLVLRKPVLIGSKDEFMMPPFAMLIPPFTLMVDALRVEVMPPPGLYGDPLIVFTLKVFVLIVFVLIESALIAFPI